MKIYKLNTVTLAKHGVAIDTNISNDDSLKTA